MGIMLIGPQFQIPSAKRHFIRPDPKNRMLWSQLGKGAYTEPNRRATEVELYDGLIAPFPELLAIGQVLILGAISFVDCSPVAGRILLQDLHVATVFLDGL